MVKMGAAISYVLHGMWNQQEIKNVQVAILLHGAGPEAQEIHSHFSFARGEAKANYEIILNKYGS